MATKPSRPPTKAQTHSLKMRPGVPWAKLVHLRIYNFKYR